MRGRLIYLDAVGYLDAVRKLHHVVILNAVAEELSRRPEAPSGGVPTLDWVESRTPDPRYVRRVEAGPPSVDPGEREVIAVALEFEITAIMDDRRGRIRARRLDVSLTGAVGVLLNLRLAGHARQSFSEDLDSLGGAGMYIGDELKSRVMERYREVRDRELP